MIRLRDAVTQVPWETVGRWAAMALVIAVLIALVLALLRSRTGRNGRRRRLEYALLPDPEFETTSEAVIRFAAQLGRVRRASGLFHHADANSIRLRLQSVGEGQFLTSIVVPREAAPGLRRAMYPDVETRPISEVIDALSGPSVASGNDRQIDVAVASGREPSDPDQVPLASVLELVGPVVDPPPGEDRPPRVERRPHVDRPGEVIHAGPSNHGRTLIDLVDVRSRPGWTPSATCNDVPAGGVDLMVKRPDRLSVARAELVLARDPVSPLRDVGLDPDPLTGLAMAMGDLWDGEDPDPAEHPATATPDREPEPVRLEPRSAWYRPSLSSGRPHRRRRCTSPVRVHPRCHYTLPRSVVARPVVPRRAVPRRRGVVPRGDVVVPGGVDRPRGVVPRDRRSRAAAKKPGPEEHREASRRQGHHDDRFR